MNLDSSDQTLNDIATLLLEALKASRGNQVPESTLFTRISRATRPHAKKEQWQEVTLDLVQRELIGFDRDQVNDERKFFIREKGLTALCQ